jgi:hypothetical protein
MSIIDSLQPREPDAQSSQSEDQTANLLRASILDGIARPASVKSQSSIYVTAQENSSTASTPEQYDSQQHEHTLLGAAFGTLRSVVNPADGSTEGKINRARENDEIATVAANTLSFVPQLKSVTVGLTRATMLIDPQASFGANVLNFGKNSIEGIVLHRVANYAPFQEELAAAAVRRDWAAEAVTNMRMGFAIGATQSALEPRSYMDQSGNFSLVTGLKNVMASGTAGSIMNLPAGAINRGAESTALSIFRNNRTAAYIGSRVISGYSSGALFDGVMAVNEGESLPNVLGRMNRGGIVGALTNVAITGSHDTALHSNNSVVRSTAELVGAPRESTPQPASQPVPATEPVVEPPPATTSHNAEVQLVLPIEDLQLRTSGTQSSNTEAAPDSLSLPPEILIPPSDQLEIPFASTAQATVQTETADLVTPRAPEAQTSQHVNQELPPARIFLGQKTDQELSDIGRSIDLKPESRTLRELSDRDLISYSKEKRIIHDREYDVRVYRVKNLSPKIVVPEPFAAELDKILSLRRMKEDGYDNFQKVQHIENLKRQAKESGYDQMALPSDLILPLRRLPDQREFPEIYLLPWENPNDALVRERYRDPENPDFKFESAAETDPDTGNLLLFRHSKNAEQIAETVNHEWSHQKKFRAERSNWYEPPSDNDGEPLPYWFEMAGMLEHSDVNNRYYRRFAGDLVAYGERDFVEAELNNEDMFSKPQHENFAVLGEDFLGTNNDKFYLAAARAPIRMLVLADINRRALSAVPPAERSPYHQQYLNRLQLLDEYSRPLAEQSLKAHANSEDPMYRLFATRLSERYGLNPGGV